MSHYLHGTRTDHAKSKLASRNQLHNLDGFHLSGTTIEVGNYMILGSTNNHTDAAAQLIERKRNMRSKLSNPLGGGLAVALGLLDAVLVRLVRLVVRRVVLRLGHLLRIPANKARIREVD